MELAGKLRFIDFFCGIGGFRQALETRGHKCVLSSDWDPHAQFVYRRNYGETPFGNIADLKESDIPSHDMVCGGFPCQPFSISGNQKGFEDARGTLLHEILRIVRACGSNILLLENVRNYLSHDGGRTMAITLELLSRAGYRVFYKCLNSSGFGVPQKRERLFFVCFHKDLNIREFSFPAPSEVDVTLEDILLPEDDPRLMPLHISRNDFRFIGTLPVVRQNKIIRIGTLGKGGQGERIYSPKGHAITLSAFGGGIGAKDGGALKLLPGSGGKVFGF